MTKYSKEFMVDFSKSIICSGEFPDRKILLLCESGSEAYGFKTPKSDIDLRGVYIDPLRKILSLRPGSDCIIGEHKKYNIDYQFFEIKKFLSLLIKPNFNVMEWVYTPYIYYSERLEDIKSIAFASICKRLGAHAMGWAYSMYKLDWSIPKKALYALRPMIVYLNLLYHHDFDSNIINSSMSLSRYSQFNDLTNHINILIEYHLKDLKLPHEYIVDNQAWYDILQKEIKKEEAKNIWIRDRSVGLELANKFLLEIRGV